MQNAVVGEQTTNFPNRQSAVPLEPQKRPKACSIWCFQMASHPSTNEAPYRLASEIRRTHGGEAISLPMLSFLNLTDKVPLDNYCCDLATYKKPFLN